MCGPLRGAPPRIYPTFSAGLPKGTHPESIDPPQRAQYPSILLLLLWTAEPRAARPMHYEYVAEFGESIDLSHLGYPSITEYTLNYNIEAPYNLRVYSLTKGCWGLSGSALNTRLQPLSPISHSSNSAALHSHNLPIVSIVVPFWGYLLGSLI